MWQIVLGSLGFLLYFIYDINSIRKKNVIFQKFLQWVRFLWLYRCSWNFCFCGGSVSTESEG